MHLLLSMSRPEKRRILTSYFLFSCKNEKMKINGFKGIGSILFLKKWFENKIAEKTIKIISEVIIMRYVQL
jgi:hypothetical protein